jgi:Xaa-Pro aminopeptidase
MVPSMIKNKFIPSPYSKRVQLLLEELKKRSLAGIMVFQPENRRYLSGFKATDPQLNESSGFLIIGEGQAILGTDPRFEGEAQSQAKGFYPFIYRRGLEASWAEIDGRLKTFSRLAFEGLGVTFHTYRRLKKLIRFTNKAISFLPTYQIVEELRIRKEKREIEAITRSLKITEEAFLLVQKALRPGKTEKEIAWELKKTIHQKGGEDLAFEPIVASGPNAALPHAEPTEREIKKGEPILFDFGSKWKGYCSDLSRTLFLGPPSDRFKEVYTLVRQAQLQAEKGMKAGLTTVEADALARSVIDKGGYGRFFKHSLGHGVGLSTHELPSISPVKAAPLYSGMVVTIEPGIYLPGWGGVRLEDMVVIQKKGVRSLNQNKNFYTFN